MKYLTFARHSKADGDTRGYSGERLLNYFLRQSDGMAAGILIGRSGLVEHVDLGGRVRAMIENNGTLYACGNGKVWKISGGTATNVGSVQDGPTVMAASGTQVAIVVGGDYYICDGSATVRYDTGALTSATGVAFQDGYFIVCGASAGRNDAITVSGLDDGTTFNALDFAFAENAPDEIKGIISDHGELWLIGSRTVEAWFNSGGADFPFQRNNGGLTERGCLSGQTIAKEDNSVFWIGDDKIAYRAAGSSPSVVSTREVEEVFAKSTIEGAFTFADRGHKFYGVRLTGRPMQCMDITTGLWSERSTGVEDDAWIATAAAFSGGVQYVGTNSGKVCTLSDTTYTDDGTLIKAEAVSTPLPMPFPGQSLNRLTVALNTGTTDAEGQIMLQMTRDGRVWGPEKWRSLGSLGSYEKMPHWSGLGRFYPRVQARIRITDPVKRDIYGVTIS